MYKRYFKVSTGPTMEAVKHYFEKKGNAIDQINELRKKFGFKEYYTRSGHFSGVTFDTEPDMKVWEISNRKQRHYSPRQSSKAGKAMYQELKVDIPCTKEVIEAALGTDGKWVLHGGGYAYSITCCGTDKEFFFVVPWRDVDPEKLKAYENNDYYHNSELSYLSTTKFPPEFQELKEWEFMRDTEHLNATN